MLCELVRTNNVDAYRTEVRAHPDKLVKFKDVHDSGNIPYCVMNINKKKFNYTSNAGRKKQNFRYKESHLSRMNAIHMVSVLSHPFAPYPHPSAPPLPHRHCLGQNRRGHLSWQPRAVFAAMRPEVCLSLPLPTALGVQTI